jgi:hypothetical protein
VVSGAGEKRGSLGCARDTHKKKERVQHAKVLKKQYANWPRY